MPRLFVANATKQVHHFCYRKWESNNTSRIVTIPIEIGGQVEVLKNATTDEISQIVDQHEAYGIVRADEIDRKQFFVGICYSVDKQIDVNKIMYSVEGNEKFLENQTYESRKIATAAIASSLNDEGRSLNGLEVEVIEQSKEGTPVISQGFRVSNTPEHRAAGAKKRKIA